LELEVAELFVLIYLYTRFLPILVQYIKFYY
jgi:hypothetical protein